MALPGPLLMCVAGPILPIDETRLATDERLRDDFRSNSLGVRVKDDLVLNDWRVKKGADIFHKSYGYLRTPEFSKVLAEFV